MRNLQAQPSSGLFVLRQGFNNLLDLVFPPRCAHCDRVDTRWCADCLRLLHEDTPCLQTRLLAPFDGFAATAIHDGVVQSAVHALKYEGLRSMGQSLGARLAAVLAQTDWQIDAILPVPLHSTRLRERGYNQSQLLAEALSEISGIAMVEGALNRARHTPHQVGLSQQERLANVKDAFVATADVSQRRVLIVDDVCTTGSTLIACAESVLMHGAQAVYAMTVSMAH